MHRSPPKSLKPRRFKYTSNFLKFLGNKSKQTKSKRNSSHKELAELSSGLKNVSNFKKLSEHSKLDKYQKMMSHLDAENKAHNFLKSVGQSAKSLPAKGLELENRLLKEELAEIKKRDEIRTRMLTEDYEALKKSLDRTKLERQNPILYTVIYHKDEWIMGLDHWN